MGAATLERVADGRSLFDDRATLEDTILRAWEGLLVEGRCACPVCSDEMTAGEGAAATCDSCGSELS